MSSNSPFKIEKDDHIAWLILNRPEKRNTMNYAFFDELMEVFEQFDSDPDIRVIVIKAEGKSFTAGIDLMEMAPMLQGQGPAFRMELKKGIVKFQKSMDAIEKCRKPVIAAVHGHCIGGGIDLISACDIRIACEDSLFSIRETRMAIIADLGTLQRLPHIIGHGWFRELALTGRDFTPEQALKMGFITHLCRDREALHMKARELASEIASCPPLVVQGVKETTLFSRDYGIRPGLEYVAQKSASILPSDDLMEAFKAFVEKREPAFTGD